MKYKEIKCDLFDLEGTGCDFVHCISADFRLGAGIAKSFAQRGVKEKLQESYGNMHKVDFNDPAGPCKGFALYTPVATMNVWNLVTKQNYWDKPTYHALVEALEHMKTKIIFNDLNKTLAMPKIGCGLDRLNWEAVQPIIETVFDEFDFDITVCYL